MAIFKELKTTLIQDVENTQRRRVAAGKERLKNAQAAKKELLKYLDLIKKATGTCDDSYIQVHKEKFRELGSGYKFNPVETLKQTRTYYQILEKKFNSALNKKNFDSMMEKAKKIRLERKRMATDEYISYHKKNKELLELLENMSTHQDYFRQQNAISQAMDIIKKRWPEPYRTQCSFSENEKFLVILNSLSMFNA